MKQTLALFVQIHLHWNTGIWKTLRIEEWLKQIYALLWKTDKTFCLARKPKCFYKAQQPSLNANSISLLVETQLSCFVSSLLSCLHAPFSSWISLCSKGQWSRFHLSLQVKAKITDGSCAPASLFTLCPVQGLAVSPDVYPSIRQPGVL